MDLPGRGRRPGHDLACGRSSPSSRPQDRVCHVHAGCCLAGAGSADRGGDRGQVPGKRPRPLAVQVRDRLGEWLADEEFAAAFGIRGRPGWSPSRLALVTILQRAEKLTDRPAAEAVRTRIDWQYLLGLPLDDPGFDHTVRPSSAGGWPMRGWSRWRWMRCWRAGAGGLVKAGGKQRTDSTHVVAAVAALNRLELASRACARRWRPWPPARGLAGRASCVADWDAATAPR